MNTIFLVIVAIALGIVAGIWSAKGLWNIGFKIFYTVTAVWAAGLAVVSLGWIA